MRIVLLLLLTSLHGLGYVDTWDEVRGDARLCAHEASTTGAYCYQWQLRADPSLSFVATGHEDGGEMALYQRAPDGRMVMLATVYPAMDDSSRPGQHYWGYAWDLDGVVTDENGELLVALDHDDVSDSPVTAPAWQKRVPFVRFSGHVTQVDMKVQPLKYTRMSATELAAAVRKSSGR